MNVEKIGQIEKLLGVEERIKLMPEFASGSFSALNGREVIELLSRCDIKTKISGKTRFYHDSWRVQFLCRNVSSHPKSRDIEKGGCEYSFSVRASEKKHGNRFMENFRGAYEKKYGNADSLSVHFQKDLNSRKRF